MISCFKGVFGILVAQRHRLGTDFNQIPINQAKYSIDNEVIQQGFMESVEAEEKEEDTRTL